MKKIIAFILCAIIIVSFCSCGNKTENTPDSIRVLTLKGPTGMGMAKIMSDSKADENSVYDFSLFSSPDLIKAEIILGNYDIAAVPTNVAAALYKKTEGALQVAAVNTLGVLYILENGNTVNNIADLKGKTIYCTGGGSTPEYIIRYVLTQNGINPDTDVTLDFSFTDHAELAAYVAEGTAKIAMLPEPNVTSTLMSNSNVRRVINITEEWDEVSDGDVMQGCIIVRKEFAQQHKTSLDKFLDEYKNSIEFVNSNVVEASTMIEANEILPKAALAKKAIPTCNIVYVDGNDMQTSLSAFLQILFNADKTSVGGTLPDEGFYYKK